MENGHVDVRCSGTILPLYKLYGSWKVAMKKPAGRRSGSIRQHLKQSVNIAIASPIMAIRQASLVPKFGTDSHPNEALIGVGETKPYVTCNVITWCIFCAKARL